MIELPPELIIEGLARGVGAFLERPDVQERIILKAAELRAELMTPAEAAGMLRCSARTLLDNHVEWNLTKSVMMGPQNPRFFRSEIMERSKEISIKGAKVVAMPPATAKPERKAS